MAKTNRNKGLITLAECAVMLALSIVLSFVTILKMPMGGSVTLLSMLPVCLISVKYGPKVGVPVAFLFAAFNLLQGVIDGNVFVYIETLPGVLVCAAFDYIVPFTLLGFAGIFRKHGKPGVVCGIALVIALRFCCHYITGVYIWGQWAEDMSKYLYSLLYNGQYMLPECVLSCVGAAILVNIRQVRRLLNMKTPGDEAAAPEYEEEEEE